jgi:hypothetical protein
MEKINCPNCLSTNIKDESEYSSNGIIGPGYKSTLIKEQYSCNDCGIIFKKIEDSLLTEEVLIELGFERIDVSAEESGDDEYHYFIYELNDDEYDDLSIISNDSNDAENGLYSVELFNHIGKTYKTKNQVLKLINLLKYESA